MSARKKATRTKAKSKKRPIEILTTAEIRALMSACSRRAPTGIRNRALIAVLWRAGLRISEALNLYPKDIDADAGTITVLHGKGDKMRIVGMDAEAFAILDVWLERRRSLGMNGRQPIFCTLDGGPIWPSYTRTLFPRLAKKAGIEKRTHPHALRHAHASELAREDVSIPVIQAQLGHAHLASTAHYIAKIAPKKVVDTMKARTGWTEES